MAEHAIYTTVSFATTSCASCGIQFALPAAMDSKKRENGSEFFCPNGHRLTYNSELAQLRKEVEAQRAARARAELTANTERQLKERAERKLRRVEKGVCPDCNRAFTNLRRHMETKHTAAPAVSAEKG